ncbi:MAG: helix-turn-helix transcriptional regulator [Abitibacteriaceae bacterium]|nr:helix-turn-helix transcriptional regulator [Abditibacteriaceae bacterium]
MTTMTKAAEACEVHAFNEAAVQQAQKYIESHLPNGATRDMADMFAAFGDSTRLKLLCALVQGELCVCDLSILLGVSPSAVSHQLRGLRALRLVKSRRDGKMVLYSLDDDHVLTLLHVGLSHIRESRSALPDR